MTRLVIFSLNVWSDFDYIFFLSLFWEMIDGRRGTTQSRNDETITLDNSIVTLTSNHHVAPPIDHFLSILFNDFKMVSIFTQYVNWNIVRKKKIKFLGVFCRGCVVRYWFGGATPVASLQWRKGDTQGKSENGRERETERNEWKLGRDKNR